MVSVARPFPSGALQSVPSLQPGGQLGLRLAQWLPACVASVCDASLSVTGDWFKCRLLNWIQHREWEVMQGLTTLAVTTVWERLASSARLSRCWYLQCGTQLPHLSRSCGHGLEVSLPLNAHKATPTNSFPGT